MAAHSSEIEQAVAALKEGELVVFPTETFYGIAADPFSEKALEKLIAIKGRDPQKPIALIAADASMAFEVAREVSPAARILAKAFWPGPLTIVMPAREGISAALIGPDRGVGIRVSPHPAARALSDSLGHPITATSANLSGEEPATTVQMARASLGDRIKIFLDGGRLHAAAPSTVISCDRAGYRVIRTGAISERDIITALSEGTLQ